MPTHLPYTVWTDLDLTMEALRPTLLPQAWAKAEGYLPNAPLFHMPTFILFDSCLYSSGEDKYVYVTEHSRFSCLGREMNYYFQGCLFKAFNQPQAVLYNFMVRWKASYARQNALKLQWPAWHTPSANDYFFAMLGYDDHDWIKEYRSFGESGLRSALSRRNRALSIGHYWNRATTLAVKTAEQADLRAKQHDEAIIRAAEGELRDPRF